MDQIPKQKLILRTRKRNLKLNKFEIKLNMIGMAKTKHGDPCPHVVVVVVVGKHGAPLQYSSL